MSNPLYGPKKPTAFSAPKEKALEPEVDETPAPIPASAQIPTTVPTAKSTSIPAPRAKQRRQYKYPITLMFCKGLVVCFVLPIITLALASLLVGSATLVGVFAGAILTLIAIVAKALFYLLAVTFPLIVLTEFMKNHY